MLATTLTLNGSAKAQEISVKRLELGQFLNGLQVGQRWLAGGHVVWQTGLPKLGSEHFEHGHTHCSAFVAAAAMKLGVYILRPPEHSQRLLANAQAEWLRDKGAAQGWLPVEQGSDAQHFANHGYLVVASYENPSAERPGHIAIVRPSDRSEESVLSDGPEVIQAGKSNFQSTTVQIGFSGHQRAFRDHAIRYYRHDLP